MKNIVITGASRGIGLALVRQFSAENFVYALCRSEFPIGELNDNIKVVKLDVTDESAIINFANKLNDEQVAINLLINNAGISGSDEDGNIKTDMQSVIEAFASNTVGPMVLTLHMSIALRRAKNPVMIAISSRMGTHAMLDGYNAQEWPYSASKAALSFAVSTFAINEPTIKSISVHPGWVKTSMGGPDADMEPIDSALGIKKLYETIDSLESGKMYNYDGKLMAW